MIKKAINFFHKRIGNHIVGLREVALQKNGKVCHIYQIINRNTSTTKEVFLWQDNSNIIHLDGDLNGLPLATLEQFHNEHEYSPSN